MQDLAKRVEELEALLAAAPRIDADIRQIVETPQFQSFVREFRLLKKRCQKSCGRDRLWALG